MRFVCVIHFVCLLAALSGFAQTTALPQSSAEAAIAGETPGALRVEEFERSIGPLAVQEQRFTVMLYGKRLRGPGVRASGSEETVARMAIRGLGGLTVFEKSFRLQVEKDHFAETTAVSAQVLQGAQGSGLLITYWVEPSTPLGGGSYQVFGLLDGRLVPFSAPIAVEGDLIQADSSSETIARTGAEAGPDGDMLHFRVWSGNFFVIVPVRVDWLQAKAGPAWRCMQMTSDGALPICTFKVEAQRVPPRDEVTFVRLFPEALEPRAAAQHVVVKKSSQVEFLQAAGVLRWEQSGEAIGLGFAEDLWLQVRIDGKEGWIHTQEDFTAIGLPQAG